MSGPTLLAFDLDGTLASICDDPADVRLDRRAAALIAETTHLEGVVVAILSGRDADDVMVRVNAPGAYIIGSHGLEIRGPGGIVIRDAEPFPVKLDPELHHEIMVSGLRLESKKHGMALHWRGVPYQAVIPVVDAFRQWAADTALDVLEGRCVVEARCPGVGKEEVLRWLAQMIGAARVVYAGDDVTDFGALQFAARRGRGLFVASSERVPPPGVTVVSSFRELLRLVREEVMI